MKFNWGSGIFIFLVMFLVAAGIFIAFAMRQDVNLVHEDYYERGVDYTNQMNAEARSHIYEDSVEVRFEGDFLLLDFHRNPTMKIDSGNVLLFRPSSSSLDIKIPLNVEEITMKISGSELYRGRYILKLSWYSEGLKYELDKAVTVP